MLFLASQAGAQGEPHAVMARARELRLWEERGWRLLLHYRKGLFGARSEISNRDFFISPSGRTDPQGELEATLRAFLEPEAQDRNTEPACLFPARYDWLRERLGNGSLAERSCPRFDTWRQDLQANALTLVFADAYLNNPSSMYGHTFLRLDQAAHSEQERLLDHAVNFAAISETDNGVLFALYGLAGFFPGRFSAMPYYLKVQEYSNLESRDLWEYRLNLSRKAVDRLVAHVWELGRADFPYYFFNKNCSYQLLPLIEAADPSLHLSDRWPLYVIPADTVRSVVRRPGLLAGLSYRPSQVTKMLQRRGRLTGEEIHGVENLIGPGAETWRSLEDLPVERQALVLDSAVDLLEYRMDYKRNAPETSKDIQRRILLARGRLGLPPLTFEPRTPPPPHSGHETGRLALGAGIAERPFLELSWRPALHDLLDPGQGYAPHSSLEMFHLSLRHEARHGKTTLQSLDLVRILSLSPRDPWIRKPSWKVEAGIRNAGPFGLTLGSGLAWRLGGRDVAYLLAEADGGLGGALRENHRLGGGGSAGLLFTVAPRWRLQAEASYRAYALGDKRPEARMRLEQAFDIATDLSLRIALERLGRSEEALFSLQRYF